MKILYWSGYVLSWVVSRGIFRGQVIGREHIPRTGGFLLSTNHISYYDPPFLGAATGREMAFFAKAELFDVPGLGWAIRRTNALPVKRGAVDRNALRAAIAAVRSGYGLTVFPEGTRSHGDAFLEPKPGLGLIALGAECPIVPGYIHGTNRLSECFRGRDRLRITFGEALPVSWVTSFPKSKEGYIGLAQAVMERIGEIKRASGG